jgi:hypothetical protein
MLPVRQAERQLMQLRRLVVQLEGLRSMLVKFQRRLPMRLLKPPSRRADRSVTWPRRLVVQLERPRSMLESLRRKLARQLLLPPARQADRDLKRLKLARRLPKLPVRQVMTLLLRLVMQLEGLRKTLVRFQRLLARRLLMPSPRQAGRQRTRPMPLARQPQGSQGMLENLWKRLAKWLLLLPLQQGDPQSTWPRLLGRQLAVLWKVMEFLKRTLLMVVTSLFPSFRIRLTH